MGESLLSIPGAGSASLSLPQIRNRTSATPWRTRQGRGPRDPQEDPGDKDARQTAVTVTETCPEPAPGQRSTQGHARPQHPHPKAKPPSRVRVRVGKEVAVAVDAPTPLATWGSSPPAISGPRGGNDAAPPRSSDGRGDEALRVRMRPAARPVTGLTETQRADAVDVELADSYVH